jgi:ADP-ribose pyrophosphatase
MRTILPEGAVLIPKEAKLVFKGIIYDVYQWEQAMFDGTKRTFEMIKRPDTVSVIAIKDGKLVVLEQEQPNESRYYDLPGGRHDVENETELDSIKRETLEETGMTFRSWKLLDINQPGGHTERFVYIFLAWDLESEAEPHADPGEKISVKLMRLDEVKSILAGKVKHYLPPSIIYKVSSIDELANLPEFDGVKL